MSDESNIIGCFVSLNMEDEQGDSFRKYLWGDEGLDQNLKRLNYEDYGKDIKRILFQFYVNPIPYELNNLNDIENYRKREKSIGIPIIINNENFFSKSESDRYNYIIFSILQKLDLLAETIAKKKLDTKIEFLKKDFQNLFKIGDD
ncbi:hypothetical protein J8281_11635 [Aquimarina sp. U1-2]|uniref:hypothetical protein n=1 Tax=Aquimarina sp. U1-2 TaxID=2823141 RepID=UPI001AECCE05|nr:hypothetical protein [Aquimarina sp. U1-2]MBP2832838.1 hypothetical protein [Aquimarina sp. U1-2]